MDLMPELLQALKGISNYGRWRDGVYEVSATDRGKYIYIGSFLTENEGHDALFRYRCTTFINSIFANNLVNFRYRVYKNNYVAFDNGVILNLYGHYIYQSIDRCGYAEIGINGKRELVHRIIANCFIENQFNKKCVNHKDGNKLNNNYWNLEWVTHSENTLHSFDNGLQKAGEAINTAKLTEDDIAFIRKNYKPRDPVYGRKALSDKFGVSIYTISDIVNYNTWRRV